MLGAGSVMYGANAMTAVVQIITKSAERDQAVPATSGPVALGSEIPVGAP